ncbi:AraC family transcriptional regulator [Marinococcus sp. PL1-022]|uniref:helix-turn-helix transcriptional regulator n=1 Tax=Marinococcus sp. PL1-022 TaxID=3095363 RepID=UPI0029C3D586|nr:AraC family transcriptional regulator [Marinococcus sp. PL1-022]MDX6152690.1 AraC family transcriptional regulator [Marinococcus sp. PL1-022]
MPQQLYDSRCDQPLAAMFMQYVDDNIQHRLAVPQLAEALETKPYILSRVVNTSLGQTIPGYIRKRRMEVAACLLTETDYSIRAIAKRLRFNGQDYFTAQFRIHQGLSPSAYRYAYQS